MHHFDYGELNGQIPSDIMNMIRGISVMQSSGALRGRAYEKQVVDIRNIAIIVSARLSNEIEGIVCAFEKYPK